MSLYLSHPDATPVRIHTYPKRRRPHDDRLSWKAPEGAPARIVEVEVRYADFFATDETSATTAPSARAS